MRKLAVSYITICILFWKGVPGLQKGFFWAQFSSCILGLVKSRGKITLKVKWFFSSEASKLHYGQISQSHCILSWALTAIQCLFWSECERKQCLFEGDACLRPAITCNKIALSNINFEIFLLFKANALKILLDVMPLKSIKY